MKKLSEKYNLIDPVKEGDIIKGKVLGQESSCLFVDLGAQGTGVIRGKEFTEARGKIKGLGAGKEIVAKVIDSETEEGYIELSVKDAQKEVLWKDLEERKITKEPFRIKILGANKGGLLANINGVAAFLPVSQLSDKNYPKVERGDPQKILKELQKFVGKELEASVFSLDPGQNQIILSERLKETEEKKEVLKKYKKGDIVKGEITGICNFGAFIKFPSPADSPASASASAKNTADKAEEKDTTDKLKKKPANKEETLEGLIHISELDWQLVEKPEEVVKVGEKVRAEILQIQGDKVFLSLKALKKNPWQGVEEKIKKGDIIKGKVKKLNPYGAFVEVLPKIQGLCHISEFGTQKKMEERIKKGKSYNFKILMVDPKEYKITLQLAEKDDKKK